MDRERIIDSLNDVKHTLNDLQKIVDNLELQINLEKLIDIRKDLRKK